MERIQTKDGSMKKLFLSTRCSYETTDCSPNDECGCNQFNARTSVAVSVMTPSQEAKTRIQVMKEIVRRMITRESLEFITV